MGFAGFHLRRRLVAVGISAALVLPAIAAAPVAACDWGCTPGYWKNHTDMWPVGYTTSTSLYDSGFRFVGAGDVDMLEALEGGGGRGLDGARTILLRAAVAALLNSGFPEGHGMVPATVLRIANDALASGSREFMLEKAALFDYYNNLYCPY